MLGHKAWEVLGQHIETYGTLRTPASTTAFDAGRRALVGVSAEDLGSVAQAISRVGPDVVVNCIGIVKQLDAAHDRDPSISVNALFPHRLARLARPADARLSRSAPTASSPADAARTPRTTNPILSTCTGGRSSSAKSRARGMTVRTSIVGRELGTRKGCSSGSSRSPGSVAATRAQSSAGPTTQALAESLARIGPTPGSSGSWHVARGADLEVDLLRGSRTVSTTTSRSSRTTGLRVDRSLDGRGFARRPARHARVGRDVRAARERPDPYGDRGRRC